MSPQYNRDPFQPGMRYHRTLGAKYAANEQEDAQLKAQGFIEQYIHQDYPKVVKHRKTGEAKTVQTAQEHQALGEDWKAAGYEPDPDVSIVDPEAEREKEVSELREQVAMLTKAVLGKMGEDPKKK